MNPGAGETQAQVSGGFSMHIASMASHGKASKEYRRRWIQLIDRTERTRVLQAMGQRPMLSAYGHSVSRSLSGAEAN